MDFTGIILILIIVGYVLGLAKADIRQVVGSTVPGQAEGRHTDGLRRAYGVGKVGGRMIYDLYFHYRIEKEANMCTDENGEPNEIYCLIKLDECNTEDRNPEREKQAHIDMAKGVADMLKIKPELVTPIAKEEYDQNCAEEEPAVEYVFCTD